MPDTNDRIREDLTKAACDELSEVINRRARLAAAALDPSDLTLMITDLAASVLAGALIFAMQHAKPEDAETLAADIAKYVVQRMNAQFEGMRAAANALNAGAGMEAARAAAKAAQA